ISAISAGSFRLQGYIQIYNLHSAFPGSFQGRRKLLSFDHEARSLLKFSTAARASAFVRYSPSLYSVSYRM
ncbi:MAG: hypothetical protein PHT27_08095, partial [Candidatus Izemoplasmatales bacterium]|nr:hypothetical protein [Candidatus Izemoplasmatales bacterium]